MTIRLRRDHFTVVGANAALWTDMNMTMTMSKLGIARLAVLVSVIEAGSPPSLAQTSYPTRQVTIVVPVPAGPIIDIVPRIIAQKLSARWGQPVIVENRPGASSMIGAEYVSKAAPDGYTLLFTPPNPLVQAQHFFPKLGYDPAAFTPVTLMFRLPLLWVANPKISASNFSELLAYGRANPGKLTFGSAGQGSDPHIKLMELMSVTGANYVHVPYQGLGPAGNDLLAGHIDFMIDSASNAIPRVRDGRLKILAAATKKRVADLAEVPAAEETVPGLMTTDWFALVAPPGTPREIAEKISMAIAESMREPDILERLKSQFVIPVGSSPADTDTMLKQEATRFGEIIKKLDIKAE